MKILQTPVRFYPYIGGVENYVLELSAELAKRGHKVKVICANEPKSRKIETIKGIMVKREGYIGKIANTNISLSLPYNLLKENFDVIHAHFPTPWNCDWSMIASILKNKPLILTYHNDIINHQTHSILAKIYSSTLLKFILKNAKTIIIDQPKYINYSKFLKKYKNKIVTIPVGIDTKIFKPLKQKKSKNTLFFLGILDKFHRYKGLDYLIKALAKVKQKIPNIKLIVGGKGELAEEYEELTRNLGLENNIRFAGYIEEKNLIRLYNQSQIFILPSVGHEEGFGIVLLEAMACKTPVICTNIVGVAEDVGKSNAGIVVRPKDIEELSHAILHILKNNAVRRKIGENALKLVRQKYSSEKMAESFEKIYERALE
jgi:glycosyltransferase involved in cell wall biosynthesis